MSLRSLLLAAVLGTMTVGFVALAIYVDRIERDARLGDIDAELARASGNMQPVPRDDARPGASGPAREAAPSPEVADEFAFVDPPVQLVVAENGTIVESTGNQNPFEQSALQGLITSAGTSTVDEPNYRVRVATGRPGTVLLTALPLDDFDDAVARFRMALVAGGGVILGLVALVLWALTGYLARPVTRMTATANRIAQGHLDTPIDPPSGSRETADLSVDLDRMVSRLRGALDEAHESRDAMERFLADMAHEIRTPLTALKGYSDLYGKGMLAGPADVDRAMTRIGRESDRLSNLANAMLQLARGGSETLTSTTFDVAEVVAEVASDLRAAYPEQSIEIRPEPTGAMTVVGDRAKVHQAILNLGSNACHHNPAPKPIAITLELTAQSVQVGVVDAGTGVDSEDAERIFLPFFRSETARSRNGQQGAGLGLALAKQIADRHGATLAVSQTPGGGATFTLSLPRH